ncbi:exopolysaccharide biosynthesis polyprenyl glycosylphosphotransferase [uncultured Sphingomonas sp.]|uniref:exopolysaccharide biosynthesis polyprenyl glycosylphosphotransferase n=1 Tax=uncultured Sphingomonas sp. TaxID=158754 RepID=UPI002636F326|nr:exopolysaccharide biosynthesis polyprenyl glycosylphosphotransferase [uncultured Sphingomonas sp.]
MQNLDGCATDDILDVDGIVSDDIAEISLDTAMENHPATAVSKRILDIAVSSALIVFVLPALVLVSLLIWTTSPGPILFRQRRSGLNGEVFEVLKFRTMFCTENGEEVRHATRRDARVTPLGAVLRATSIDELPQLFNVLRGDMSLVGPRPHALAHDRHYALLIADYMKRFAVRPGITGLAQIRGLRGEIHDLSCMERRVRADCEYIERWSLFFDLAIILKTIPRMVRDPNAY